MPPGFKAVDFLANHWNDECLTLYENIVIGNFLFDLGVRMAQLRGNDLPLVSINLLQQTPLDKNLGDVLLANVGLCRLIEFKRKGQLTNKELDKLKTLRSGIDKSHQPAKLRAISRQIHWFLEIEEPKVPGENLRQKACPYFDFKNTPDFISMEQFAKAVVDEACTLEPDEGLSRYFSEYIKWVSRQFGKLDPLSSKRSESAPLTAFLVAWRKEDNRLSWVAVPSIECMFMNKLDLSRSLAIWPGYRPEKRIEPELGMRGNTPY